MNQAVITDNNYPNQLALIHKAPPVLYYKGNIDCINQHKNIAVIGSRHISGGGMELAYRIGHALGKRGINVVNGLALGCDTYALKGALAAGGNCVAVMPCGLGQIVPRSNIGLAEELLFNGGCLVSEYPVRTPVQKYRYVERDRLQSGISDGVLVIEAEYDSGTMYTVGYAMKQGKKLACIDSRLVKYSSGNRWLEQQTGVQVIRTSTDLETFISAVNSDAVYRQLSFLCTWTQM